MLTGASATKRTFTLQPWYTFKSIDHFPSGILPTKRDVLQRLIHEQNWHTKEAAQIIAKEIFDIWIEANVCPISQQAISQRILNLGKDFDNIHHYPAAKRKKAYEKKIGRIKKDVDLLFDVFNKNEQQRRKMEKLTNYA